MKFWRVRLVRTKVVADVRKCDGKRPDAAFKMRIITTAVEKKVHSAPGDRLRDDRTGVVLSLLPLLLFLELCAPAPAQPSPDASKHSVVVLFADHPMNDGQWTALLAALRVGLADGGVEVQSIDPGADFLRGDDVVPGFLVDSAITVYLHGDCTLSPALRRTAFAVPLGWVRRVDGRIEPFVHVDCTRIGQVLGPQAMWMSRARRIDVMAGAMARVILHECIHIATQSSGHAERGIAKADFGVADLMGNSAIVNWPRGGQ
jgi:hypothetical protein